MAALSIGRMVDLIELMCRGVDPSLSSNHELVRDIINLKLKDFAQRTGALETSATISSIASQKEYELPADKLHVKFVYYDDSEAKKITHKTALEMKQAST